MAEGLLKKLLEREGVGLVEVASAGTMAPVGLPSAGNAVITMMEKGIDISDHRAQLLTAEMADEADLILVMERAHLRFIESRFPTAKEKTFLLKALGRHDEAGDIDDPIGGDLELYQNCRDILEYEIERILPTILEMSAKKRGYTGFF